MLELTLFALGALIQAFITLQAVTGIKNACFLISPAIGAGVCGFIPLRGESGYNFYLHYGISIGIFMLAFGVLNNKKILPVITERFLLLFNIMFIYFIFKDMGNLFSEFTMAHLFILIGILIPSIMVLLNGLIPGTPPAWMKTDFYVWYLIMAAVLLFRIILPNMTALSAIDIDQVSFQDMFMIFSVGMLSLSLSVDVVNVLLLVPYPSRDETFAERIEKIKLHIKLLNSKYEDEDINPWNTVVLIGVMVCLFALNAYVFNLSDFLVATVVFVVGRFVLSGYHVKH